VDNPENIEVRPSASGEAVYEVPNGFNTIELWALNTHGAFNPAMVIRVSDLLEDGVFVSPLRLKLGFASQDWSQAKYLDRTEDARDTSSIVG
jgi:hypothetical protein